MAIENWVKLTPNVKVRMHFKDYRVVERSITDPWFDVPMKQQSLVFLVDRLNGEPVSKRFSVLSEKTANELQPYLEDGSYKAFEWVFEKPDDMTAAPRITRLPV